MSTFAAAYGLALLWAALRAVCLFTLGRLMARGVRPGWQRRLEHLSRGALSQGSGRLLTGGAPSVALAYLVPGVCEASQILAGYAGVRTRTFATGIALAALPWAVVDASIGSALWAAFTTGGGLGIAVVVAAAIAGGMVWRTSLRPAPASEVVSGSEPRVPHGRAIS